MAKIIAGFSEEYNVTVNAEIHCNWSLFVSYQIVKFVSVFDRQDSNDAVQRQSSSYTQKYTKVGHYLREIQCLA